MRNLVTALALAALLPAGLAAAEKRPNLLLIVADDLCWRDLGFTGNEEVKTPNLDRLRSEGMYLSQMYTPATTCSPSRHALYTGLYCVRAGAYPNHTRAYDGTRSVFTHLMEHGYRVALQGKTHVGPPATFPFERLAPGNIDNFNATRQFLERDAAQPWLLVFASNDPHGPWTRGPKGLHDPKALTVPPYLHDNDVTRRQLANYYGEINKLDQQVGELMKLLRETGQEENTLVLFVSEQGSSFPYGGKWSVYDNGIRAATVARWPGKIQPGSTGDALVQYVDIPPTFLDAAGVDPTKIDTGCPDASGARGFDGKSFLDVLLGKAEKHRDYVFAQHTTVGIIGYKEPYPMRAVRDARYKLIRNLAPRNRYHIRGIHEGQPISSWQEDAKSHPKLAARVEWLFKRPAEELYDFETDEYETRNLADDPKYAEIKARLGKELDAWMAQQGDKGMETELRAKERQGRGRQKQDAAPENPWKGQREKDRTSADTPVDPAAVARGLKRHDRALFIKEGWIRDPYIVLGPDGYYYLTGTTPLPGDPRERSDPYNTGLGPRSIVGWKMRAWRGRDLIEWEDLGTPFTLKDGVWDEARPERFKQVEPSAWRLWAPELHFVGGRWAVVHTSPSPVRSSNLSFTPGAELKGPFTNPMGETIGHRHDPSLFRDDDGTWWLVWGATQVAPLKADFTDLAAAPVTIGPSGDAAKMGHEGCLIRKIGGKYVLFGTGWSTGQMRKGSYNLYYAVADRVTGPYGPRQFAGRFLGHGTPFQDKQGRWWCTAFYNADVPPLAPEKARGADLSETAQTINRQGVTIVPLDVRVTGGGAVVVRAKDPDYASPGPDEAQKFHPPAKESGAR